MSRENGSRVSESEWGAELLRITVFYAPDSPSFDSLWQTVVGEPPESSNRKPKTKEVSEIGLWRGGQLQINSQKGRVDWLFSPGEVVGTALESPPAYVESVGPFLELFGQWKPAVPIVRFAFGGISNLESPNAEASYSIMSNYMNFDLDRSLSSDFIYQINKKRESGVISPVLINRLTKWSCAQAGQVAFAIVDEKITSMAEPGGVRCFCRLEFDINTIPIDGYVLPEDKLIPLANELDGMAREIMREGDL